MNKRFAFTFFLCSFLCFCGLQAQVLKPVKWTFSVKKINDRQVELILKARIEKGWHLYSQYIEEGGPIPTAFTFHKNSAYELFGKVREGKPHEEYDPNFEMNLKYFEGEALFKQKIKILDTSSFTIKGTVEFMVCDNARCLPPEELEFSFAIEGAKKQQTTSPADTSTFISKKDSAVAFSGLKKDSSLMAHSTPGAVIGPAKSNNQAKKSPWGIFIAGFIGGLLALITPCVFPMIPLTVSFFTKQSKTRKVGITNAFIYGVSIILIYVGLGMLITLSLGPDALNAMASNVYVNLAFFVIFIVFAFSFLGAFEITLPSAWVNRADSVSERGGLIGIFFMAFTLSLVSFSCTGPIVGTLLVQAAVGGNVLNPVIGMTGFSLALALPFGLFAAFPGWLNTLPKSGGWLNSVKVVLGLIELALALKFLSNVDLAYHWGILTREVFIALWIIIFALLGFYLLGKIKFSHDSDLPYVPIPRLLFAILVFAFVVYLIPGMWGAPLRLISGFPPPEFYTEGWSLKSSIILPDKKETDYVEGIDREHCPHNLSCFHDYDLAMAYARKAGKPLMVDFTGWSCVNCRKMEDNVWIDPRVLTRLENDFVLVSLYVDDKEKLPEKEQYVSPTTGNKIKTKGNKWSDLQTTRFGANSQPYYVLLDHNEQALNDPSGYEPDIETFIRFLDRGKEEFQQRKKVS